MSTETILPTAPLVEAPRVLVVEDESTIRHVLQRALRSHGCEVTPCESAEVAIAEVRQSPPAVVLLDIILPGLNGLEALSEIKRISPDTEIVMMTSQASIDTAIRAIREGAYDYLNKPFEELEEVWITIQRALEKNHLALRSRSLVDETRRQNRELSESVERLTSMVEASRRMSEFDSVSDLGDYFIEYLSEKLGVDRVSLMLLDAGSQELTIVAHRGLDDVDADSVRVDAGHGIAGRVVRSGEPFLVAEAQTDERLDGAIRPDLADSFISAPIVLSVPLKSSSKVLGVVNLTNRRDGQRFDEGDLSQILTVSSHLAVAIEKVRYLQQLEQAIQSLRDTQEQLVFSERLKVVGEMAAGLAHEFNNLLAVIAGRAEIAKSRLACDEIDVTSVRANLDTITMAALQGSKVVERIGSYTSSDDSRDLASIDLNEASRSAVEITQPRWKDECSAEGRSISIEYDLCESARLKANAHEITQAIGNLVLNAVEAVGDGGTIKLQTRHEGDSVVLRVEDDGRGMDEQARTRLFEPFFSTKQDGQGLGATLVRGIVNRHGGTIDVQSAPGRGSVVTLRFGVTATAGAERSDRREGGSLESRTAKVLLVDDDELVRETYEEALQMGGHQVLPCSSGRQALQFFEHMEFDLVITDLSMGEMSGLELARQIKKREPSIPVVLLSGWAGDYVDGKTEDAGIDHVLKKPCPFDKLLATVQTALTGPGSARVDVDDR